jgi:DNA-binding transcriptional MerR regulator
MGQLFTIGQLANQASVSRDTIRYYERLGLLPRPARTSAGYRQYPPTAVNRLVLVRRAQRFGFSLREIAAFLHVRDSGGKPCRDVRAAAQRRLDAVERQIVELVAMRDRMAHTLHTWDETLARTAPDRPARLLETLT